MIAPIRQSKRRESSAPIVRARRMVAETLLPDKPVRLRRRVSLRKILFLGGFVLLALVAILAYSFLR
jgi:hypothetical protein